ncbi:hypothetical protein AYO22_07950 [Fonsecaea multimorphosa]|nr:hypothetical protein AYO22_07950 [Fonsecaea multimorphosa]
MVPVYGVSNLLAAIYYKKSIYFLLIGNAYAAFGLASFFNLVSSYIAPDLHQQKVYFRTVTPKKWKWPISWLQKCTGGAEKGLLRNPRSGLTWFNIIFFGVFQYCFVLMTTSIAGVIAQIFDRYCSEAPIQPAFAHIYVFPSMVTGDYSLADLSQILVFNSASAIVSSYCLVQYHDQNVNDVSEWKSKFQFFCINIVLYLSTYQTLLLSILVRVGAFKATYYFQTPDLNVTLPATLLCAEMAIISLLHLWAYPYKPYTMNERWSRLDGSEASASGSYQGGLLGLKAFVDVLNWWDIFKAIGRATRWMFVGRRGRHADPSYALRTDHTMGSQFGATRRLANFGSPTFSGVSKAGNGAYFEGHELLAQNDPNMARRESDNEYRYGSDPHDIGLVPTAYRSHYSRDYI